MVHPTDRATPGRRGGVTGFFSRIGRGIAATALALGLGLSAAGPARAIDDDLFLTGVNIAGAEFNPAGTKLFFDYTYPTTQQLDYWTAKGFRVFRVPFLTKRLLGPTTADYKRRTADWQEVAKLIAHAYRSSSYIILDMHEYGGVDGVGLIGKDKAATRIFVAAWTEIARRLKDKPNVIFGIMNEPNMQSASQWLVGANAGIAAIRKAGARQLILVPGSYWSGAHSWVSSDNDTVMRRIKDPAKNYAIEVHQYLDGNSSGTSTEVVPESGTARLATFTAWARKNKVKGFLGEFGFPQSPEGLAEGRAMVEYMAQNSDAWLGWTAWAAGAWWGPYMFSLEPDGSGDKPQVEILTEFQKPLEPVSATSKKKK